MEKCPICNAEMENTKIMNTVLNEYNYFCSACDSYHIINKVDVSKYYQEEYHTKFSYKNNLQKVISLLNFSGNRTKAHFKYLNSNIRLNKGENFIEIGGGTGEKYVVFNKHKQPKLYTIIEPDSSFNFKKSNLLHINALFNDVPIEKLNERNIVIMFHVLEHIYDLSAFFEKLKKLEPKYFYFEVPNCRHQIVKEDSLKNHPHFHHFSKQSMDLLLKKNGLHKICLDEIEPVSYHPYKQLSFFFKYFHRLIGKNERKKGNGIYIRGVYQYKTGGMR